MPPPFNAFEISEIIRREFERQGLDSGFAIRVASGESGFNPSAIGDQGASIGIFQLHERGLQPAFFQAGFTDLNDPLQQAQFVAAYIAQTRSWQPWTVARQLIGQGMQPDDGTTAQPIGAQGVGDVPDFSQRPETPEERQQRLQDELEVDIAFLREQEALAQQRGDREAQQRLGREIALLERQLSFQGSQADLDRAQTEEQAGLNRELQLRLQRLSDANNLTMQLAGMQQQARDLIVDTIGKDPFRGAVRAQGGVGAGITPLEQFRTELQTVADRPVERTTGEESLQELQAITERQRGLIDNPLQTPIGLRGLKHGGIIDMEKDGETFRVKPNDGPAFSAPAGSGVLVGESGAPEVLRITEKGQLQIIPLVARAVNGATLGGQSPTGLIDLVSQPGRPGTALGATQGLRPLFEAAGIFGEIPLGTRAGAGFGNVFGTPLIGRGIGLPQRRPDLTAETFQRLGTTPRLVFVPELQTFFQIDPNGQGQIIGDARRLVELGGNPNQAFTVPFAEAKELGFTANPQAFEQESLAFQPQAGQFGAQQPIFSQFTEAGDVGVFLPDPALLAAVWPTLDPDTKRLAVSAYGLGNVSEAQLERRISFFTPQGTGSPQRTALLR